MRLQRLNLLFLSDRPLLTRLRIGLSEEMTAYMYESFSIDATGLTNFNDLSFDGAVALSGDLTIRTNVTNVNFTTPFTSVGGALDIWFTGASTAVFAIPNLQRVGAVVLREKITEVDLPRLYSIDGGISLILILNKPH